MFSIDSHGKLLPLTSVAKGDLSERVLFSPTDVIDELSPVFPPKVSDHWA